MPGQPETWRTHAGWNEKLQQFEDFGHPMYVRAFGHTEVIEVEMTEGGEYWGWLEDGEPTMIYRREVQFRVCFPYGPEAEQHKGRIVRLRVDRLPGHPVGSENEQEQGPPDPGAAP